MVKPINVENLIMSNLYLDLSGRTDFLLLFWAKALV
jgi:hypothetical protein